MEGNCGRETSDEVMKPGLSMLDVIEAMKATETFGNGLCLRRPIKPDETGVMANAGVL